MNPPPGEATDPVQRTCLYQEHRRRGALLVDFHGWEMPVRYTQIPAEHQKVREGAGVFDLCHMGRLEFRGPDAEAWVDRVVTTDVGRIPLRGARYGLLCADDGGIIDDLITYRLPDRLFLVVNASNRTTAIDWFQAHRGGANAELEDVSEPLAMVAIQGPAAADVLAPHVELEDAALDGMAYYTMAAATVAGHPARVATTGYTGERGFEVFLPREVAADFWGRLLEEGGDRLLPIGLGARDTLRVEAGMPLYGNELTRRTNPYEVGLGGVVKLDKEVGFPGRESLARIRAAGAARKLRGFRVDSRRVARAGMAILQDGRQVGEVTSGIPSPTLGYPVAMGLIERGVERAEGLEVDVRGRREPLVPAALPFFSRTRKKSTRAL